MGQLSKFFHRREIAKIAAGATAKIKEAKETAKLKPKEPKKDG